jgi:hypothetical protein
MPGHTTSSSAAASAPGASGLYAVADVVGVPPGDRRDPHAGLTAGRLWPGTAAACSPLLGRVTFLVSDGARARGRKSHVALSAFLRGHLADDEPALGDGALHVLVAGGSLGLAEVSL